MENSIGSPIISKHPVINVIGLHYGSEENKKFNTVINVNSIINDIINQLNHRIIIKEINFINSENNEFYKGYMGKKNYI